MKSSAHFLKLVWSAVTPPRPASMARTSHSAFDHLYAALEELRRLDSGEARRMMRRMLQDLRREGRGRRVGRSRQLDLFQRSQDAAAVVQAPSDENAVPWRSPFLVEEHSGPCPRCGRALVERSRVGASIYYACTTHGCPNTTALFLLILGTGDD